MNAVIIPTMGERSPLTLEQRVKREVLKDLKELAYENPPETKADWNLIWAFSGPHGFHQSGTWVKKGPDGLYQDIGTEVNEAITRFIAATQIVRQVTALRVGKNVEDVTLDDIRVAGPKIFYNEWDWQNDDLRELFFEENGEKQFEFPKENLIIPQNSQVMHTGHQFEKFPDEVLNVLGENGKFVLVSDLYHLPRIKRHAWKRFTKATVDRMVFYPSQPLFGSFRLFRGEIRRVVEYGKRGNLSWSPPQ